MKNLILAFAACSLSVPVFAYEETILCWRDGVAQTDENAMVILGTGAEFEDVDTVAIDGFVDTRDWESENLYAASSRYGNCQDQWYSDLTSYSCQEKVIIKEIYYGTDFSMVLNLKTVTNSNNGVVILNGSIDARRFEAGEENTIYNQETINVTCTHRAE